MVEVAGFEPVTSTHLKRKRGIFDGDLTYRSICSKLFSQCGICSFNPDISACWKSRNSSESPYKSPHRLRRANDNPKPRFLSPFVSRSSTRLHLAENLDQRPNPSKCPGVPHQRHGTETRGRRVRHAGFRM